MEIKKFKPITPGRRYFTVLTNNELQENEPTRVLTKPHAKTGGRNNLGRVTSRHRGGGNKRKYRIIDFKRDKDNIAAKVASIEYDPNRSANIALLKYLDGARTYILAPKGLKVGDMVESGEKADIKIGNALKLKDLPLGTIIHNIELQPGKGGKLARSAGNYAQLVAREGRYAQLKLPSGEVRKILVECRATIGQVGNELFENISLGKAGRSRWLGKRPHVRGVAMNPVDHPHGGGEGKTSGGRHPVTPWGVSTKGHRTRKSKNSDKFIVKRRYQK